MPVTLDDLRERLHLDLRVPWFDVTDKRFGAVAYATQAAAVAGTDSTLAIQDAINAAALIGGTVVIPAGFYKFTSTIRLKSGIRILGHSSGDVIGTVLVWTTGGTTPAFDTDSTTNLAWFGMQDIQVIDNRGAPGGASAGTCFKLYCPTNNSYFRRVEVIYFRADAWALLTASNGDPHCAYNVVFEQCFAIYCGGFAFNCDGDCTATWTAPDFNHMLSGGFYFANGTNGNQNSILIQQLMWEGSAGPSTAVPITFANMGSGAPVIIAPIFYGAPGSGDAIQIKTTTGAFPLVLGAQGINFTNLINDTINAAVYPFSRGTVIRDSVAVQQLQVKGPTALRDLSDTSGTSGKRWLRELMTAGLLVVSHRADDGSGGGEIYRVDMGNGVFSHAAALRTPTTAPAYSASITPDAALGTWYTITVTNGTAFTINAPANPPASTYAQELTIEISNTSGGAMGVVTWNAIFKLIGGAFVNPATGLKRFIRFSWNGSAWVETGRAAADY